MHAPGCLGAQSSPPSCSPLSSPPWPAGEVRVRTLGVAGAADGDVRVRTRGAPGATAAAGDGAGAAAAGGGPAAGAGGEVAGRLGRCTWRTTCTVLVIVTV